jgi:predicted Zn-dependent protease
MLVRLACYMSVVENLEALLARGQDNALLRYGLGNEFLKAGDFARAIEHLRACLAFDSSYSSAWKLLGKALAESSQRDDAITAYENGIAAAEKKGDLQAAKEMRVFLKRLQREQIGP